MIQDFRSPRRGAWAVSLLLSFVGAVPVLAGGDVHGRRTDIGGLPVVEVWGTRTEAAHAIGYFTAEQIVPLFDDFVIGAMAAPEMYETVVRGAARGRFDWQPYMAEAEAVVAGARQRLGAGRFRSEKLGRELDALDICVVNSLADWYGVLCSTFSAWDELTVDGQTLTARNLDFPSTPSMARNQVVLVYRSSDAERPWVGVTWPGLLGVYTGMNAEGVTVLMHDANGKPLSHSAGFTARSLILREVLESAAGANFIRDAGAVFRKHRVLVGNNIHVSGPRPKDGPAAAVFEYDGNDEGQGVTVRLPRSSDIADGLALACTNHVRERIPPGGKCWRYDRITEMLTGVREGGEKLDADGALKLIQAVKVDITLHSVVAEPSRRRLLVQIPAVQESAVWLNVGELVQAKNAAAQR